MIRKTTKTATWFPVFIWLLSIQSVFAQYPLGVQVNIAPPYPIRISDFTSAESNIFVTVTNTSQASYKIFLSGSLRNEDNGMTISTDPNVAPGECIDIPSGGRTITGAELRELFDPSRLGYRGTSISVIRGDQALPEGSYTLCLRAEACDQRGKFYSPIPSDMDGCSSFEVAYVEPPEITAPDCGGQVELTAGNIPILWSFIPPATGMGNIMFKIEMVELEPATRNPTEAMGSTSRFFEKEDIQITSYNLLINDDVAFEGGKTYAFRVIAYDKDEKVQFRNHGESNICTFRYGEAPGTPLHPRITAEYPMDGDVVPFNFFPLIVKFDPYDQQFNKFISDVSIVTASGAFDDHHRDLDWGDGPLISQRSVTGNASLTQEESQYIAIYKNKTEEHPAFSKKHEYTWNANIEMRRGSRTINTPRVTSTFKVGMAASKLSLPLNGDTVPPGLIKFKWKTADAPQKILPDFAIVQDESPTRPSIYFKGTVDERWVIEISKSDRFDVILEQIGGRLGATINLNSTADAVTSELYKNLEETFTITPPGKYFWRVKWMNSTEDVSDITFYAVSEIFTFVIGTRVVTPSSPVADAATPEGCKSVCEAPAVTDRTAKSGLAVGDNLTIGKFTMVVQAITTTSGTQFTGDGYVQVPFMNNIKIKVEFRNIQYNAGRQIFSGTVKAKEDRAFVTEDVTTRVGQVLSMSPEEAENLSGFINDGERLISAIAGTREIGMPIGIDREIDGNKYTIGIINMEFTILSATIDAVMSLSFTHGSNRFIAFGVKDLCITPTGLGDEGRLYLARDLDVIQEGETKFTFKGAETADTTASCYVSWDCRGFLCARIQGEVTFPRSMLVPDQADGTAGAGFVKGNISFKACRGSNFMTNINIDPFQIKGVDGWGWVAQNAWLDFSDLENPPGFRLPAGYSDTALLRGGARMINTWQGFYMETIQVRIPAEFQNNAPVASRKTFEVRNTIIDGTGITTSIRANNILPLAEGTFKGWGISLDTINIDFVSNSFIEAGISGKLGLPIFADGQNLNYHMALTYGDEKVNYLCRVFARDSLTIPMWVARVLLRPDSEIRMQIGDSTFASTNLSGDVSINDDSTIPGLNFKGMVFEGLKLSTSEPHFDIDSVYFSSASPQKSVAGFPINVKNISLTMDGPSKPGINFDLDLVLGNFGAELGFGVYGVLSYEGERFRAGFDRIDLRSCTINQNISGVALIGGLTFYKNDGNYGNGVKGFIDVSLPMKLQASLTVQFGTKRDSPTAEYNTAGYYSYWFVDGLVSFPTAVPIFSGFGIYGFGGGVYHHMRNSGTLPVATSLSGSSGGRTSVVYTPDFGTYLGIKLTAVLGTMPSDDLFNMDATISAEITREGGLSYIGLVADGYIMASRSDRSSAKVKAKVDIGYHVPDDGNSNFHGNCQIFVNVNGVLHGAPPDNKFVDATLHVDKDKWYFYLGTLENPGTLTLGIPGISASLSSYLMLGHDIPTTLPPPPQSILDILYGGGPGKLGTEGAIASQLSSRNRSLTDQIKYNTGKGIAFGASFDFHSDLNFAIFYASLDLMLGFDINITKDPDRTCPESGLHPGINNWYATGQVYAGFTGELGVNVDLWFISGKFKFIELSAAVMLTGGLPDPYYFTGRAGLHYEVLNGLVEGQCNFKVDIGTRCTPVSGNPLSGVEFIADIRPQAEDSPASVFEQPRVSFNLPVEKIIEFPAGTDANPNLMRRFRPFIASFQLIKTGVRDTIVPSTFDLSEGNTIATLKYTEALASNSNYKVKIVVKADEIFQNGTTQRVKKDGVDYGEPREATFNSGLRPDHIDAGNVKYTYPIENQKFFLKGETRAGIIGLLRYHGPGQDYLFYSTKDGKTYSYFVRFKSIPDGDPIEVPLRTHGRGSTFVDYTIPALDNDKMYAVQIIRRRTVSDQEQLRNQLGISTGGSQVADLNMHASSTALTPLRLEMGLSDATIQREGKLLPGATVTPGEFLLYNYYFKTSKYNTLQEKMGASAFTAEYKNIFFAELFDIGAILPENFDQFDIHGVYKNGVEVLKPLLGATAPFDYSYHTAQAKPYVYDLVKRLQVYMSSTTGLIGVPTVTTLNRHRMGLPPTFSVSMGNGKVETPLSINDVESAAGIGIHAAAINSSLSGLSNIMNRRSSSLSPKSSYQVSSFSAAPPADPTNFRLNYETSNFVFMDFNSLKGNVSRILSAPGVREAMQRNNPQLLNDCIQLLRKSVADFNYTQGQYGVDLFYRTPTIVGNATSNGGHFIKTFRYGSAPAFVPKVVRPRTI